MTPDAVAMVHVVESDLTPSRLSRSSQVINLTFLLPWLAAHGMLYTSET